ncbi:MAG: SHOCT domain-containing protein [Clostridium tyrobutyricum]|nr:SHOCT domain-containing protein [Clostridium tyrobutyricum]
MHKRQGIGCVTMFIFYPIYVIIVSAVKKYSDFPIFKPMIICFAIAIIIEICLAKIAKVAPKSQKMLEVERKNKKEDQEYKCYIDKVKYITGYEDIIETQEGSIGIKKSDLVFFVLESYSERNISTQYRNLKFRIPLSSIIDVIYNTSEKITLTRVLMIGMASLALKKKTYYLIVNYKSNTNIKNQVIFQVDQVKRELMHNFLNKLNMYRNKVGKRKLYDEDINIKKIRELSRLKDEGIITKEEFEKKKRQLLYKI